jgi:tryptophan synthase alpha chain
MTSAAVTFAKANADHRAALVGYLPAGFPTVAGAIEALQAMAAAGQVDHDQPAGAEFTADL